METALFRIVQEGMTNVVRHAHATAVTVHLGRQDNDLTLEIVDNGQGFDPDSMNLNDPAGKGVGLRGMRERTTLLGGVFHLQSAPGHGTKIQVRVPIPMKEGVHG
jgi:signal transduction histidine kinase